MKSKVLDARLLRLAKRGLTHEAITEQIGGVMTRQGVTWRLNQLGVYRKTRPLTPPAVEMKAEPGGSERWFDRCPRCSGVCDREPGASRCRLCGRIWYIKSALEAQADFERVSGMIGARDALYNPSTPVWKTALRPIE